MIKKSRFLLALLMLTYSASAESEQLTATAASLSTVFAQAKAGDTIDLIGSFGETKLTNRSFSSTVTIDASAASFFNTFYLNNISNVNIIGGSFGSSSAYIAYNAAINVIGGNNVSFIGPDVVGFFGGHGIVFEGTNNAYVSGATLSRLQSGVIFSDVDGGSITSSKSLASVADGFDIVDSSHIDISGSSCTGSTPLIGAHPDCVQIFSKPGAVASDHIDIHDNYVNGETQGFDNFGSGPGASFISIENNTINGLFPQGIICDYCINSTIADNVVTSQPGAPNLVKIEALYGSNNEIYDNSVGPFDRASAAPIVYYNRQALIDDSVSPLRLATRFRSAITNEIGTVPEPYTWSMMIIGFVLTGTMRRSRSNRLRSTC